MTAPAVVTETPAVPATPPVTPVATPAVTPAVTPATAPQVVESVAPVKVEGPLGPLSRREVRAALQENIRQRVAKAAETAAPVVAPEVRTSSAPSVETKPAGASETPRVAPSPAETLAPPGPAAPPTATTPSLIVIPVPEGHPLREMGVTELVARNAQEERAQRATINSYTRRQEVAALQAKVNEYELGRVEQEARDAAMQKWMARPEYETNLTRYQEIKDAFGEPEAEAWWRGVNAEFDRVAQQEFDTRMGVVDQQRVEQAATAWKTEAWSNVSTLPAALRQLPVFSKVFEESVPSFDAELRLGHYPQVQTAEDMHREFGRFFQGRLVMQPEVKAAYAALNERETQGRTAAAAKAAEDQRQLERIKQEAVEEWKRQEATKATATPPHPLGNLAAVSRDHMPVGSEAAEPAANVPVNQLRRDARAAAVQRAKQRFGLP